MTKRNSKRLLYLAAALISGVAPLALSPIVAGLSMAAINLALAFCT
jgi:hypothetical protein